MKIKNLFLLILLCFIGCVEELPKFVLTVHSSGNGTVSIENSEGDCAVLEMGASVTVVAIPDEDSEFVGWFEGDSETPVSKSSSYTFKISKDVELVAEFAKIKKTVSIKSLGNGSVSIENYGGNSASLPIDSEVTIVATPDEDYEFVGWFLWRAETPVSIDSVYTFTVSEDIELSAKFEKGKKSVSVNAVGNGSVSIRNHEGNYAVFTIGSTATVVATPDENYKLIGWFIDENEDPVSTSLSYSFPVNENINLTAKFEAGNKTVSIKSLGNGSVSIENYEGNSASLQFGSEVTIVATPDEDYEFVGWFLWRAETPVSIDSVYTFTVSEDIELSAKFEKKPLVIDLSPSGSIDGYDYVDLGLSVSWATYNVGANDIVEIGEYYAWGETTPYNNFTNINYSWSHYPCSPDRVIASIYDAATVNWGDQWRMPTYEEQQELSNGCEWIWVENLDNSNVSGYVGVSLKNKKCIFLPASGYKSHHDYEQPTETDAIYWSSTAVAEWGTLGFQAGTAANCIKFMPKRDNPVTWDIWAMGKGATVRAVVGAPNDYFPDPSDNVIDEAETSRQGFTVNGEIGGYTYVDMGLPSGTLWATYNVGAELPSEYGDYFAWGETAPKSLYDKDTYKFFTGYSDAVMSMSQYSKYVWDKRCGEQDYKLILEDVDDAATVNWGSEWCMPTIEQYAELDKYCKVWRKDIVVNGKTIIGAVVESCINGNRMYIPAAGWEAGTMPNSYMSAWYWTSEVSEEANYRAKQMIVKFDDYILDTSQDSNREYGLSVRAVVKKNK